MATRSLLLLVAVGPTHPLLPLRPPRRPFSCSAQRRRWDSNAETARSRSFGFDFTRRDQNDDVEDEDDDAEEGFFRSGGKNRRWWSDEVVDSPFGGMLEEAIDTFWVFKVFKAYGWLFPLILISWLLTSCPKGLLMELAIPLAPSTLSFAFYKLWGGPKSQAKRWRSRVRRRRSATGARVAETEEDMAEEGGEDLGPRKGKSGYQSLVVGNGGSVGREGRRETGFGGWDDLERAKSAQRPSTMGVEEAGGGGGGEGEAEPERTEKRHVSAVEVVGCCVPFSGILD